LPEHPLRGQVWLLDLGEPIGHEAAFNRPALVISDDPANRHGLVVVCPIGTAGRNYPTRVELEPGRSGLDQTSYIQCEQVRTVSTRRLVHQLGAIDRGSLGEVEHVLRLLLRL